MFNTKRRLFDRAMAVDLMKNHGKFNNDPVVAYPQLIIDVIEDFGGVVDDDFDTNGWQYDYWITFELRNVKYTVCGCGYYGSVEQIYITDLDDLTDDAAVDEEAKKKLDELLRRHNDLMDEIKA